MVSKDELKQVFNKAPLSTCNHITREFFFDPHDLTDKLNFASSADLLIALKAILENKQCGFIDVSLCITVDKEVWDE